MPRFNIPAEDAQGPLVVGIDIGSGGTRAAVYDVSGREVGKLQHKEIHAFTVDDDGTSTIDADQIVAEIRTALSAVLGHGELPGDVRAIGFDTFASSLIAVDTAGNALVVRLTLGMVKRFLAPELKKKGVDWSDVLKVAEYVPLEEIKDQCMSAGGPHAQARALMALMENWAKSCMPKSSTRKNTTGPAGCMRRSAVTKTCCLTWCAACWRTARIRRS